MMINECVTLLKNPGDTVSKMVQYGEQKEQFPPWLMSLIFFSHY
jgi:hypothetical protein